MRFGLLYPRQFTCLYNTPGDGGAGGGSSVPPSSGAPAPAAPASPAPSGGAAPIATPAPAGAPPPSNAGPQTPAPSRFEYPEDRSGWVPPHRLSSIAQRAQEAETRARTLQAMIEAGTGVRMREEQRVDPAITEARDTFDQVFPGASALLSNPKAVELLSKLVETLQTGNIDPASFAQFPQVIQNTEHGWQQHARQQLSTVFAELAPDFGTERLTPRQERAIGWEFNTWLEEDQTGARVQRYTQGDPRLTQEFITEYRSGFVDPFRRRADAATMQAGQRVQQLPTAPRRGGLPPPVAPVTKPTEDQVHAGAWAAFQAAGGAQR